MCRRHQWLTAKFSFLVNMKTKFIVQMSTRVNCYGHIILVVLQIFGALILPMAYITSVLLPDRRVDFLHWVLTKEKCWL